MRPVTPDDEPLFNSWVEMDAVHKAIGITFADLVKKGTEAWLISDDKGPVIFLRGHLAFRVAMQFDVRNAYRTAKIAEEVVERLNEIAKEKNAIEVIIRPGGKAVSFSEKLGFMDFNGKFLTVKD